MIKYINIHTKLENPRGFRSPDPPAQLYSAAPDHMAESDSRGLISATQNVPSHRDAPHDDGNRDAAEQTHSGNDLVAVLECLVHLRLGEFALV